MSNLARKVACAGVSLEEGRVEALADRTFLVATGSGRYTVRRAVGCLVEPAVDDAVLVSFLDSGAGYILSVLERRTRGPAVLGYDGDVTLRVRDGRLQLSAQEGLALSSDDEVTVAARRFSLAAEQGEARVGVFSVIGRFLQTQAEQVSLIAEAWDAVVERVTHKLRLNMRFVSEMEEVQAGSLRQLVDGTMTIHARNTSLVAEQHVKVDAEQIHLG